MCPSRAVFVATDAAIFLFPFPPRRPDKSRPAYVYEKRGFNEGFEWTLKEDSYFAIFLFPVLPSEQDKSRPAYVDGKTRV